MKIELEENSKWGGILPDILRNDRVTINLGGVILKLKGEEFEQLRNFMNTTAHNLYNDAVEVIKRNDIRAEMVRQFQKKCDVIDIETPNATEKLLSLVSNFYYYYWESDLEGFMKDTK